MNRLQVFVAVIVLCFFTSALFAQSPQAVNYQTVIRDVNGALLQNQNVSIRMSFLQGSASGSLVYREVHKVTSNDFGLVNLQLGQGIVDSGTFAGIDWSNGPYYLQVGLYVTGGTTYITM